MRCVAGVGLLVLGGCNQIFGITASQPWDAPIPPHYAVLTWQVAATGPTGAPNPALDYPGFAAGAAPAIRIAPLDGLWETAAYATIAGIEGRIDIPASYLEKDASGHSPTWRLEYTLPDGSPPHEVQWVPDDNVGHLTVPVVGRLDRQTVPVGSGYTVTVSPSTSFSAPRVWTTGLWTDGQADPSGATADYDLFNATSLSGPKGRPDPALDRAFLVDFTVDAGSTCRVAVGAASLGNVAVDASGHTVQTATWDASRKPVSGGPVDFGFIQRLLDGLGNLQGSFIAAGSSLLYGVVPSLEFPGLTGSSPAFQLPIPVMQTLLQCPFNVATLPSTAQPAGPAAFRSVIHAQLVDRRTVAALGINLFSGMETVIDATLSTGVMMEFPAAIPTRIQLTTPASQAATGALDLSGSADQLAAGAPSGPFTLEFTPETGTALRADYYDVYLHRIMAGALTTERIYTVTAPRVRIDPSVLVGGADYVFEIRSYKGHARAVVGDFTAVDYPYGSAVVFTRTFRTS